MGRAVLLLRTAALLLLAGGARPQAGDDLELLLAGVGSLGRPGVPGPLACLGPDAFPVATGASSQGSRLPVVAALRHGRGRAVAFGHGGYLESSILRHPPTARLVANALAWAGRGKDRPRVLLLGAGGVRELLQAGGLAGREAPARGWIPLLGEADLVCLTRTDLGGDEGVAALQAFLREGGGLVAAGLGWGWQQLNPERDLRRDFALNRLLGPLGVVWGEGYLDEIEPGPREGCHAGLALARLAALPASRPAPEAVRQLAETVVHGVRSAPPGDPFLGPRLGALAAAGRAPAAPGPGRPLDGTNPLDRILLAARHVAALDGPPDRAEADPGAAFFPGAVPPEAPREAAVAAVDPAVPGWASTGLYAPPGETIELTLPRAWVGLGLKARLGCHQDRLWLQPSWRRHPEVDRTFPLEREVTRVASPHGGLLYLVVPGGCTARPGEVGVRGAVAAPRFVRGRTGAQEWRRRRLLPAPWGELETNRIVLTVPAGTLRTLADPEALLAFWDDALGCYADLGMRPLPRRPERIVADLQIGAGYMHAGYPIMTHLDAAAVATDLAVLRGERHGAVWGLWHELGHNHQRPEWTFAGAGEVTCNLFTLYVLDRMCGMPPDSLPRIRQALARAADHLAAGAPFAAWQADPFLGLAMYVQIQQAFGWRAFQDAFAAYRELPPERLPRTDAAKRDLWLERISRAAGRDLSPFFAAWGVPTGAAARAALADLEAWPAAAPERAASRPGGAVDRQGKGL